MPAITRADPHIVITVPDGVKWTATPTFSTEEFVYDAAITADCSAFTDAYSAIVNAETGFTQYAAFDHAVWERRIQAGATQLAEIGETSQSTLAGAFSSMATKVAAVTEPGRATVGTESEMDQINSACSSNQTPYVINAEFGG